MLPSSESPLSPTSFHSLSEPRTIRFRWLQCQRFYNSYLRGEVWLIPCLGHLREGCFATVPGGNLLFPFVYLGILLLKATRNQCTRSFCLGGVAARTTLSSGGQNNHPGQRPALSQE
ncbi:hypothetical protein PM082_017221 [Marasmius tenuissimus]|nr:hypothetical protein PM082_017221 [Marasmius tenuissimus]